MRGSQRGLSRVSHDETLGKEKPFSGIVAFNFSPRNLTQVTSAMKPV